MRGNDWESYLHPPCRPKKLTEDYFHRRHWIYGINHQINTDYATPTTTNLKTVNGDRINVHGKMTLTIVIPSLRRNYNFTFYIADVKDNILGLDFLKDEDINISNLTVTNNVTNFTSTRNNSPTPSSQSPVLAVSLDLSQIPDTALRKIMEQHSSVLETPTSTRHVLTVPLIASPFRRNLIFVRPGSFALKSYLSPNLLSTKCNA